MGGDEHSGAEPVQFGEQADQPLGDFGIDIAGGLVGQQQIGPRHHRARNRHALLLAARKRGRARLHAVAKPHPGQ